MNLAEKIHAIQSRARKVAKRGEAVEQKGREYNYLLIEDAVHVAKIEMRRLKLILTPTLSRLPNSDGGYKFFLNRSEHVIDLVIDWTLEDIESKEARTYSLPGSGWDLYDKASAKAMTNSRKYAFVLIFNLEVDDNAEDLPKAKEVQKEIAKQKIEEATGEQYQSLEHAEAAVMDSEEAKKLAKKSMTISWPEAHNGFKFMLTGRRIAPVALHQLIESCEGKWNDREMGWFIAREHVNPIRDKIKELGLPLIEHAARI